MQKMHVDCAIPAREICCAPLQRWKMRDTGAGPGKWQCEHEAEVSLWASKTEVSI
jgi:hypothetical protein